ncbi:MAG: nicotinate-nucleotide--dimethylbenzimidazole phosphoribosyltransferase [Pseudomonadales bacterium]|nr:nicotinate-nucleotide--dimethylbenzimidazole phosphoribosyltransferase [Pseudomonadales bacterium]
MGTDSQWWQNTARDIDPKITEAAQNQQNQLTKPQGSLGRLEAIAIQLAGIQNQPSPLAENIAITVFAGDHGVVEEGISAFPQTVTGEMIKNFAKGGAAISVLSQTLKADLQIVNVGSITDTHDLQGVINQRIAAGTANFTIQPAMTEAQLNTALQVGKERIDACVANKVQIWLGGEMGIGNTTSASAIISALLAIEPRRVVGPGTGLDANGISRKVSVIQQALSRHQNALTSPLAALQYLGGFEIVALAGAYIRAAQCGIAAIVDGFICGAAALAAVKMNPSVTPYLLFSHRSAEPGHQVLLDALQIEPIVDLNLRLGEGSGAAVCVPIIQMATQLHNKMATFEHANVSEKLEP